MAELNDVIIAGGSAAGLSAAKSLRRDGYAGRITMLSEDVSAPYKRPPLSKELLVDGVDDATLLLPGVPEDMDVRLGQSVVGLDLAERVVECADGTRQRFDGLVVATGAAPLNPWGERSLPGVHVLRTLADARRLRSELVDAERVAVVGAGFIGAEVASAARSLGREVTLIDALSTPHTAVLGERVGAACAALHADHGTSLRMGRSVAGLEGTTHVEGVRLSDGELIAADLVVVGVGVRPNTAWLADSGIAVTDGVHCDSNCAVLDVDGQVIRGVVAAGDVARWPNPVFDEPMRVEHWDNAIAQGRAAARTLLGEGQPYAPIPYFWSDQYATKIQFVGSARSGDDVEIAEGDLADRRFVAVYRRGGRIVGAVTMNLPQRLGHYRKLIGSAPDQSGDPGARPGSGTHYVDSTR